MFYTVYGVNTAPEQKEKPYDHFCPAIGNDSTRPNMHLSACLERQKKPYSEQPDCAGGCRFGKDGRRNQNKISEQGRLSDEKRYQLVRAFEEGRHLVVICIEFNRSEGTVRTWYRRWESGKLWGNKYRSNKNVA